jgi:hypothetical protein
MIAWVDEFIAWHERIIVQYPSEIQNELRQSRTKWLVGAR